MNQRRQQKNRINQGLFNKLVYLTKVKIRKSSEINIIEDNLSINVFVWT